MFHGSVLRNAGSSGQVCFDTWHDYGARMVHSGWGGGLLTPHFEIFISIYIWLNCNLTNNSMWKLTSRYLHFKWFISYRYNNLKVWTCLQYYTPLQPIRIGAPTAWWPRLTRYFRPPDVIAYTWPIAGNGDFPNDVTQCVLPWNLQVIFNRMLSFRISCVRSEKTELNVF